ARCVRRQARAGAQGRLTVRPDLDRTLDLDTGGVVRHPASGSVHNPALFVTSSPPGRMPDRATWPSVLLLLSGADAADLARRAAAAAYDAGRGVPLVETAATLAARRAGPCRLAVVAADAPDAVRKLEAAAARLTAGAPDAYRTRDGVCFARHAVRPGKVAFLFPGFGSAYPGMFASAVRLLPGFGRWFDLL